MHGGRARQVREAGKRRVADARATAKIEELLHNRDAEPVTDPLAELSRLAGVLRDAADVAGTHVNALSAVGSTDMKGSEQLRAQVQLWERLLGLTSRTLVDMSKIDQGYRLAKAAWEQEAAVILGDGLRWLVASLGHDPADPHVSSLVVTMLRTLDAGQPLPPVRVRAALDVVRTGDQQ